MKNPIVKQDGKKLLNFNYGIAVAAKKTKILDLNPKLSESNEVTQNQLIDWELDNDLLDVQLNIKQTVT